MSNTNIEQVEGQNCNTTDEEKITNTLGNVVDCIAFPMTQFNGIMNLLNNISVSGNDAKTLVAAINALENGIKLPITFT